MKLSGSRLQHPVCYPKFGLCRAGIPVHRAQFEGMTGISGHDAGIGGHDTGMAGHDTETVSWQVLSH